MLCSSHRYYYIVCIISALFLGGSQIISLFTIVGPLIDGDHEHHHHHHLLIESTITPQTTTTSTGTTRSFDSSSSSSSSDEKNNNNNNNLLLGGGGREIKQHQLAPSHSRFAYAFLIAGCDPDNPTYRGFFYNVLVSTQMLKSHGSTSDVVVLLQMSQGADAAAAAAAATSSQLPPSEERMLYEMGIRFRYLPTPTVDTFYSAMMTKFAILDLVEYERVLYLDADIMPLCNLDHLFHLSTTTTTSTSTTKKPLLKENLVVAWWKEPASGGCFMLTPGRGEWQQLQAIVAQQHNTTRQWPYFDPIQGWGHVIQPPDYWITLLGHRGTNWTFQFAFADQGLLYHWVKYVKRSVSIVFGPELWNWSDEDDKKKKKKKNGSLVLEKHLHALENYTCPTFPWENPNRTAEVAVMAKPLYRDLKHFTGSRKPWVQWKKLGSPPPVIKHAKDAKNPFQLWFHILRTLRDERQWQIDVDHLNFGKPILGKYPTLYQMAQQHTNKVAD